MAEKSVLISQQFSKPIKILKWKVAEGSSLSLGGLVLFYDFPEAEKREQRKLKSVHAGTVKRLLAKEEAIVKHGEPLLELQSCIHPTVMRDMCADCGTDLRKDDLKTTASIPMVHSIPELKVNEEEAQKLGKADGERLLKDRKLVLLVDLDQTLIHTTNDNIPPNIKDVYHFQLYGPNSPWYHTKLRPRTHDFLKNISSFFELHICTFGARNYAHMIATFLDSDQGYFSNRILSRDECFDPTSKKANLKALFPCGDNMVCIIDDREDVWNHATNLIHVKPYHFFQHTGDINAPPGLDKHENDELEGIDLTKIKTKQKKNKSKLSEGANDTNKRCVCSNGDSLPLTKVAKKESNNVKIKDNNCINEDIGNCNNKNKSKENETLKEAENKTSDSETVKEAVKSNNEVSVDTTESEDSRLKNSNVKSKLQEKNTVNTKNTSNALNDTDRVKTSKDVSASKAEIGPEAEKKTSRDATDTNILKDNNELETPTNKSVLGLLKVAKEAEISNDVNEAVMSKDDDVVEAPKDIIEEKTSKDEAETLKIITEEETLKDAKQKDIKRNKKENSTNKKENESSDVKIETESSKSENSNPNKEEPSNKDDLIIIDDKDDYLIYLEDILKRIHKAFYMQYDKMESGKVPDLKQVIPAVRSTVLKGTKLVFSGLVPTHVKLEQSKAYQVAKSLGASVTQDIENDTTHLVAIRPGTAKVNAGRRKKNLKIVTPDWLWACAEQWEHVDERVFPLNSKGSKNRHPPPHCSSPEHVINYSVNDSLSRKRTASGRFMDTINPLMTFSSDDIADMDKEVEDILLDEESDSEDEYIKVKKRVLKELKEDKSSSSSDDSITGEYPRGFKRLRKNSKERKYDQDIQNSSSDESPSEKFKRGEQLDSDIELDSNSEGSAEAPDEVDDGEWNMMGAALEREFLSNN